MIDVVGERERLIVMDGPSRSYRWLTSAWPAAALMCLLGLQRWAPSTPLGASLGALGSERVAMPLLVMIGFVVLVLLLRGWRTITYRFDRERGTLEVTHAGPLRARAVQTRGLGAVARLLERRASGQRQLELVLDDGSVLVIARESEQGRALDRIASELGGLLGRSLELDVGVVIAGRYEVERRVPRAGAGAVYRALDRKANRRVALRLVPAPEGPEGARFERELARLAQVEHEGVARVLGHGKCADGQAFVASAWHEGEELSQVLARGALGLSESLRVLRGAARALSALHAAGIVHGRLGPASFTLGAAAGSEPTLNDAGMDWKAPRYLAPEQATLGHDPTPATDVFALGCLFHSCLTGQAPFAAEQSTANLAQLRFDAAEPLREQRPGVPDAWAQLATRLLAKEPAARPADADALLAELERLPEPAPEPGEFVRRPREVVPTVPAAEEPIVVAVVVVAPGVLEPAPPPASAAGLSLPPASSASTASALAVAALTGPLRRSAVALERLRDGSLVACAASDLGAADPLRAAACAAACLQELLPQAPLALASGVAQGGRVRIADTVAAAVRVLARAPARPGIYLDATSSERLDARVFDVDADTGVLRGERLELEPEWPLLGRPSAFAGRGLELLELETFVRRALTGARERFAWVLGPAGIGKSRLASELVRRLPERHPNSLVLTGAGDERRARSPYALLGDALRVHAGIPLGGEPELARQRVEQLCSKVEPAARARVRDFLGELCGVVFTDAGNAVLSTARSDPRVMRAQVHAAFREWLASESTERAVLLVLEDVHWGDAPSLELLNEVRDEPDAARLCVLAFARPEVEAAFPALFGERASWSLVLGPLHGNASAALVAAGLGAERTSEAVARIVRRAAGNPLFLEELVRAHVAGQTNEFDGGAAEATARRIAQLAPEARRWLALAATIGARFWSSALQQIGARLGGAAEAERWLELMDELELLRPCSPARRAGEREWVFRHALLAEAAARLLGEAERRAAELASAQWLDEHGETDAMVLARYLEQADPPRARALYARAAEQSLAQRDYAEALARASLAQSAGARAEQLGEVVRVQMVACHGLGQWTRAAELGLEALELLPFGGALWCATVEELFNVLASVGDFKRAEELSEELEHLSPAPDVRAAHARALHAQLEGYAVSADHERGRARLELIDGLEGDPFGGDRAARGQSQLWRAAFIFLAGEDLAAALELARSAEADLQAAQAQHRTSMACSLQAFVYWGLGCLEESERAARRARALAVAIKDAHHTAVADAFLGLALAEQREPERWLEAERCAKSAVALQDSPLFEATWRSLSARVALKRGDFALAVADGRRARAAFASMPPYALMASALVLQALTRQGKIGDAVELAHEDLTLLDELGGPVCSDVMFGVAAAEALFESGDRASAASVLGEALQQIERRSGLIADHRLKQSYLTRRPEVRRALQLKDQWLREG
jgi:hypothetical protein